MIVDGLRRVFHPWWLDLSQRFMVIFLAWLHAASVDSDLLTLWIWGLPYFFFGGFLKMFQASFFWILLGDLVSGSFGWEIRCCRTSFFYGFVWTLATPLVNQVIPIWMEITGGIPHFWHSPHSSTEDWDDLWGLKIPTVVGGYVPVLEKLLLHLCKTWNLKPSKPGFGTNLEYGCGSKWKT